MSYLRCYSRRPKNSERQIRSKIQEIWQLARKIENNREIQPKIRNLSKNRKFCWKIRNLSKNRKFCWQIQNSSKNQKFYQKIGNPSKNTAGWSSSEISEESIAKTSQIWLNELFAMLFSEAEKFWTPNSIENSRNLTISSKNRK